MVVTYCMLIAVLCDVYKFQFQNVIIVHFGNFSTLYKASVSRVIQVYAGRVVLFIVDHVIHLNIKSSRIIVFRILHAFPNSSVCTF